jgi:hypothetical protein
MQCEEFEDRLNQVLDARRRPEWDAELRLHCEACPECRDVAIAYGVLLDGFYALAMPEVPADMAARVLCDVRPRLSPARRVLVSVTALAIAAGLLIVVVPVLRSAARAVAHVAPVSAAGNQNAQTSALTLRASRRALALSEFPIMPELLAIQSAALADAPYETLAKETGQGLATLVLYVPGIGGTRGIIDVDSNTIDDEPPWAAHMSEGFRPVTQSVTETLNLLLRAMPLADSSHRS